LEAIFGDTITIDDKTYDNAQGQTYDAGYLQVYDTLEVVLTGGTCELSAVVNDEDLKAELVVAADQTGKVGSRVQCDPAQDFSESDNCSCSNKRGWNFATLNFSCIAE
jgi:hypothetical protein